VSDGTEDAHIFPIVSSRIKVNSVRRVLVKQSQTAESTYYVIARALQEKRLLTPLALILLILGIVGILGLLYPGIFAIGVALTLVIIGIYIFNHTYRIDEHLGKAYEELKKSVTEAKVSLPFMIVAFIVLVIGIYFGYDYAHDALDASGNPMRLREKGLLFADRILLWCLIAGWIYIVGNVLDVYIRRGRIQYSFYVITISLLALGFITYAAIDSLKLLLGTEEDVLALQWTIYICIISGLIIAVLAAALNMYVKMRVEREARWRH
jgi:putative membrane protein